MAKKKKKKVKKKKPRSNGKLGGGRNNKGQFLKGHKYSVGNLGNTNLHARALKTALLEAVTEKDIEAIAKKLLSKAKAGDIQATKELFDRLWGRAIQEVDIGANAVKSITDILAIVGIGNASSDS